MSLAKRTRFILIQSTRNANATEDNTEPYHISIFRRSSSMPPLPKRTSSTSKLNFLRREQQQPSNSSTMVVSKSQQRDKDEILPPNKFYRLNIQTMKKKSARITMRLSSAFGLTAHTIDEQFNFQEQRFRAIEKFLKLFQRNIYISIEAFRETILTQVDVAEDLEELLNDKMPDLVQQFLGSKRSLLEHAFKEFRNHIELYVIHSINILIKLFILPSNLISKRHNKLLDYDSAQSAYEKVKDQQVKQAKQVLDLSKQTYEILNNQLLEELPILYEHTCQILSICFKEYIRAYFRLIQQMKTNTQLVLNQTISAMTLEQLNWQQILERFTIKNNLVTEQFFQLTITAKNFSERLKHLSTTKISLGMNNTYNYDKETYIQTDEIRQLIKNRYPEKDLYTVIQDYNGSNNNRTANSRSEIIVQNGDIVSVIRQYDGDNIDLHWFVDNGITQGYIPHSILIPITSNNQVDILSSPPPIPIRQDLQIPTRAPLPLPRTSLRSNVGQTLNILSRNHTGSDPCLINSAHDVDEQENEGIYLNQVDCRSSSSTALSTHEYHQYAAIDPDDCIIETSTIQEEIYIALYDFNCAADGVLCLTVGERLKILQRFDGDGNNEWWYVEKINDTSQKGYVPANYIEAI
ncbi:unnamed protein product [Adineta steineri]|uniref:SH3 domain-containing protein n=1 Tax=Adineta steineri TaxID=433720 RepID=A0A815MP02_9BILA|nr:unnamed protein product [Adineta steineri]CAF1425000.1 unnamed protein product [Adineta steineri]CAF1425594.1 unnamed protein product [Adineta steineri]